MWVLLCLQELCRGVGPAVFVGALWRCGSCCVCSNVCGVVGPVVSAGGVGPAVFAGVCRDVGPDKTSGLIWIQTV